MTIGQAFFDTRNVLLPLYDDREAAAIAHALMEHITGMSKLDRLMYKDDVLEGKRLEAWQEVVEMAVSGMPLQYIVGRAWFMDREYMVNEHVLIPRPETEELVHWVRNDRVGATQLRILDVGTGSGCIPISLKKEFPDAVVASCDISAAALDVARHNAAMHHADITFIQMDFLDSSIWQWLEEYDIIISNPPYIPVAERGNMHRNVKDFEPELALFVPDNDALVFYRALAEFGKRHLVPGGSIYCETERRYGHETRELFATEGYCDVILRQDMHDNDRMVKATRPV